MGERGEGALLEVIEGFECVVSSQSGGVAVVSALVGGLGVLRMFRWRANWGGRGRSSNGGWAGWSDGYALPSLIAEARFGYPRLHPPGAKIRLECTEALSRRRWLDYGRRVRV